MAPKKKKDKADDKPKVNLEEVQLRLTQLSEEIVNMKQDIDDRAKDHADSLSQYDVAYPLSCLALSNGVLYSGSLDKSIVGIDSASRQQRFQVTASHPVHCLFVMASHDILFAGAENVIQAWDASSSDNLREYHGHDDRINCLREYHGELMSASHDGTMRRWDRKTQRCLRIYDVCEYPVSALECLEHLAYCATWDNCVRCVDLKTGDTRSLYKGHDHVIHALKLVPKETMTLTDKERAAMDAKGVTGIMYTGAADHKILSWELNDDALDEFEKQPQTAYKGHLDCVYCVTALDVPDFVAELTGEKDIPPEGAMDPEVEEAKPKHNIPEFDLAALRDEHMPKRILITGSDDRSVRLFDCETGMCMLVLIGHTDGVSDLGISGGNLYTASFDRTIRSWHLLEALVRIQMRRKLKTLEQEKLDLEGVLEENSKKKKGKKKKKK